MATELSSFLLNNDISEDDKISFDSHMMSQKKKESKSHAYYRYHHTRIRMATFVDGDMFLNSEYENSYNKRKLKYKLLNNEIDHDEIQRTFNYFNSLTEVPENFHTQDIISSKIKALKGIVQKRPHKYSILAVNPEATSERSEKENELTRQAVIQEIMSPIEQQIDMQFQEQLKGKKLSVEQQQQLEQQKQQQKEIMTPFSVKKYMNREYKDSYTILATDLSDFVKKKVQFERLTNDVAIDHAAADAMCVAHVYEYDGHIQCDIVNNLHFGCSFDEEFTQDCEYACCKYYWSPSKIVKRFDLTDSEIKTIYRKQERMYGNPYDTNDFNNSFFIENIEDHTERGVEVVHTTWRSLRKYGILYHIDEEGMLQKTEVDETYELNEEFGDIKIEWKWDDEIHECWCIAGEIYKNMRPLMFQGADSYENKKKLPYVGVRFDNLNRTRKSFVDRILYYYIVYAIVWNKLEGLISSDKGKKIIANHTAIPRSQGIDLEKWLKYANTDDLILYSSAEPGMKFSQNNGASSLFTVADLSLASDIQKYINILEYIDQRAGDTIGIPRALEAKADPDMPVRNMQQSISQSVNILEPFLRIHDVFKNELLLYLVDTAKFIYSKSSDKKLIYILDDYSQKMIELNKFKKEMLVSSTYGLYANYSDSLLELQQDVHNLLHAAMQNQTMDLSAIMEVLKEKDPITQIELSKTYEQQKQNAVHKQNLEIENVKKNNLAQEHENELDKINVEYDRKEDLAELEGKIKERISRIEGLITYSSFAENKDQDNDGTPDVLEFLKHGENADIEKSKLQLEKDKLEHQKNVDKEELKIKKQESKKKNTK